MTPLYTAAAIGLAFGLGFWAGGKWFATRLVWSIATGTSATAKRLRAALGVRE